MLLYRLKEIECLLRDSSQENGRFKAVSSLKNLLLEVDFKTEVIPDYSFEKLSILLIDLKESELTNDEELVLKEIISNP